MKTEKHINYIKVFKKLPKLSLYYQIKTHPFIV